MADECSFCAELVSYPDPTHKGRVGLGSGYTQGRVASFPGLHAQLLSLAVRKVGEGLDDSSRDACHGWRHVQSAHVWVCSLPFTLLSLNSVRSFCSVCAASPIATGSIVASYSTWRQPRHASRDKSVQALFVLQATKAGRGWPKSRNEKWGNEKWGNGEMRKWKHLCMQNYG